jgi:general secretion pathway protein A
MYEEFYGLRERPFDLTPNPRYLLLTSKHEEALGNLKYGLSSAGNGITLLLGEAGTGKTTLLRKVLVPEMHRSSSRAVRWAYLTNPKLSRYEFFDSLGHAFQLSPAACRSKSTLLRELERNVAEHRAKGVLSVVVGDEAQSLPDDLLEEVRLLANMETDTEKLLPIVLVGQPAFGDRLNQPGLTQLKQRIGLRCTLLPLDLNETAHYIAHRISLAGGHPVRCFTREAVRTIHERSRGIPRTVNVICENALLTGFVADARPVGADIVLEVCRDFDVDDPAGVPTIRRGLPPGLPPVTTMTPERVATAANGNTATSGTSVAVATSNAAHRFWFPRFSLRWQ